MTGLTGSWESKINIHQVVELGCAVRIFLGVGALQKMDFIADELIKRDIDKVLIATDDTVYKETGIKDKIENVLNQKGIAFTVYNEVKPNPTVDMIDEAKKIGMDFGAKATIGIGGGSNIDTAKSAAVLIHKDYQQYSARDLYEHKVAAEKALPIIAINTTHGTGSEVDSVAVASIEEKGQKPGIFSKCLYPLYAIEDPEVTKTLPWNQTTYTSLDALNHAVEAATTVITSPYSIMLSKEAIRLVVKYLPEAQATPENLTARYFLMYASFIATIAADNALLHITHALEHPLSGIRSDLSHGYGLAMLFPAVVKAIYPVQAEILSEIFEPIVPSLKGKPEEADEAARGIEKWLFNVGVTQKLTDEGFTEKDIDKLIELAFETPILDLMLSVSPIEATNETLRQIYMDSLYPLNQ